LEREIDETLFRLAPYNNGKQVRKKGKLVNRTKRGKKKEFKELKEVARQKEIRRRVGHWDKMGGMDTEKAAGPQSLWLENGSGGEKKRLQSGFNCRLESQLAGGRKKNTKSKRKGYLVIYLGGVSKG